MKKKPKIEEVVITLDEILDQEGDYLQAQWIYT